MTDARSDRRAALAAVVTVLLWSSAFVAIRDAGDDFSPAALALGRLAIGSLALGALLVLRRGGSPAAPPGPASRSSGCSGSASTWSR